MHETQKKLRAFGNGLKILRKLRKLSQADLGAKVGLDASSISRIENATAVPNFDTAIRLAAVFDLCTEDVVIINEGDGLESPPLLEQVPSWMEDIMATLHFLTPKEQAMLKAFLEAMKS